jgi:hypothetical protein
VKPPQAVDITKRTPKPEAAPATPAGAPTTPAAVPPMDETAPAAEVIAPPAGETSWVDEPHCEWLEETPAMLAAKSASVPPGDTTPPVTHPNLAGTEDWDETPPNLELPRTHDEHAKAETLEAVTD